MMRCTDTLNGRSNPIFHPRYVNGLVQLPGHNGQNRWPGLVNLVCLIHFICLVRLALTAGRVKWMTGRGSRFEVRGFGNFEPRTSNVESRFSRQSRPSRLSQAYAITAEALMNIWVRVVGNLLACWLLDRR
jgi:hypothetical protein